MNPSRSTTAISTRRRGFTLVELLVVVGIIAMLVGILLPALNKARQSAQAVACQSNLRQIGIGFRLYAESNKGSMPSAGDDGDAGSPILMPDNMGWASDALWMNAVSKAAFCGPTTRIYLDSLKGGPHVPKDTDHHVLVCSGCCPEASGTSVGDGDIVQNGYFMMSGYVNNNGGSLSRWPHVRLLCHELQALGIDQQLHRQDHWLTHVSETVVVFENERAFPK